MANIVREARQQRRLDRLNHRAYRRAVRRGKFSPLELEMVDIPISTKEISEKNAKKAVMTLAPMWHYDDDKRPTWYGTDDFADVRGEDYVPPIGMNPDAYAFGDVFNWYRKHLKNPGPNTTFKWRGKTYTTETLAEKQAREAAERAKKEQEMKDARVLAGRVYVGDEHLVIPGATYRDFVRYAYPEYFAGNDSIPYDTIVANIPLDSISTELGKRIYNATDSTGYAVADSLYGNNDSLNYLTVLPYFKPLYGDTIQLNDSVKIPASIIYGDTLGVTEGVTPQNLIRIRRQGGKFPIFRNGGKIN